MLYKDIINIIPLWENSREVRFITDDRIISEHMELYPGVVIKKYGYCVIGTTIGGNAITINEMDDCFRYCSHSGWHDEQMCLYAKNDYNMREYSPENVRDAQIVLANSLSEFDDIVKSGILDKIISEID